ncbi:MAG: nuclear transport factor 2 family protein [Bacteroidales bacterium]
MKKISLLFVLFFLLGKVYSANDEEQVKQVILDAYVNGIQNKGSLEDIEKGFHPSFELIGIGKDGYTVWENHIYTWKERVRQNKEENPGNIQSPVSCEFEFIDITGNACIAKIQLFRDGRQIFTDYLSLYKFKDGWRIVSKIFERH